MKLLISQKDTLYDLIEIAEFSPSQFEFGEVQSKTYTGEISTILKYKDSDYYFLFDTSSSSKTSHHSTFCPGNASHTHSEDCFRWDFQIDNFKLWLSNLKREINTPNKWDRLYKEIVGIEITFENEEDKFSFSEFEILQQKISLLKVGITSIALLPNQSSAINNKLDHLIELAKEMNKFDWKGLFIGTMLSIIIQLSVSPENAKLLWKLIKQIFNNYILP